MDNRNLSLRKILSVAKTEYIKWVTNPRMILFVAMIIFVYDYIIKVLIENSDKMSKYINVIEPFIAIGNSPFLLFVIPIIFLALISDFPKSDGNSMFYMIRTGKVNWMLGQLLFAIYAGVSYIVAIFAVSCLCIMKKAYIYNAWSDVTTKYFIEFPDEKNILSELINARLYNNLLPNQALLHTSVLVIFMIIIIALVQLLAFSYSKKILGLLLNITVLCVGIGSTIFEGVVKWVFPVSNAITWMHYDDIFKKPVVPIVNSYMYFGIILLVLIIWNIFAIKRYDFSKVEDLED
ncbi:MAG: hypothetical protein IJC76_08000 [Lachnospiraceae bacterium]|nr:hypothetical protein [Lachnospiraceae bacterium]